MTSGLEMRVVFARVSVDITAEAARKLPTSFWFARLRLVPVVYGLLDTMVRSESKTLERACVRIWFSEVFQKPALFALLLVFGGKLR